MKAWASSFAVKLFAFKPSRASARVSLVRSVTVECSSLSILQSIVLFPLGACGMRGLRWEAGPAACVYRRLTPRSYPRMREGGLALLHHLRDDEEVIVGQGGVLDDVVGDIAIRHLVLALLEADGHDTSQRLDIAGVDLVQLLDPIENARELALEPLGLLIGDLDACEPR